MIWQTLEMPTSLMCCGCVLFVYVPAGLVIPHSRLNLPSDQSGIRTTALSATGASMPPHQTDGDLSPTILDAVAVKIDCWTPRLSVLEIAGESRSQLPNETLPVLGQALRTASSRPSASMSYWRRRVCGRSPWESPRTRAHGLTSSYGSSAGKLLSNLASWLSCTRRLCVIYPLVSH